jgi:hypothetical protein
MSKHEPRTMSERMIDHFMKKADKQGAPNSDLKLDFQQLKKVKMEEQRQAEQDKQPKEIKGKLEVIFSNEAVGGIEENIVIDKEGGKVGIGVVAFTVFARKKL